MSNLGKKVAELSPERERELLSFTKRINLPIKDFCLLNRALTHSSYANECITPVEDNERLEFLGDSVLQLCISSFLYSEVFSDEGSYTRLRSSIVSEDALYSLALKLHIQDYILIGKGEEMTGGRQKKALLSDAMEAVIGAAFLSCGFNVVSKFILDSHYECIQNTLKNNTVKDYKTTLQEYVQLKYKITPVYNLVETKGPEHNKTFFYSVSFDKKTFGPASGKNKKDAEQNVAMQALLSLKLIKE